ncbi:MAG: ComEC/Rec2 family competence protein, partial [Ezakiella massiliensis]
VFIYSKFARNIKYEKTLAYYLKTAFLLNISIQIATLPIVIYYFNKVNILTIFINILLVPIFSLYLILSVCLLLFSKINFLAYGLAFIINSLSKLLDIITAFFNKNFLMVISESPAKIIIVIYYLILLGIIFYDKLRLVKLDYKTLIIMALILSIPNPMNFKNKDRVEFLDVGQGDAALISIGEKNIMIDSGGNPRNQGAVGKNIIEPYLIKTGRRKIDYAFISHYDYDHAGGFTELSDDIKIKHVIVNHKYEADDDHGDFKDKLEKLKPREVREDASFNLGKDYSINFIGGNQDLINENDRSIVAVFRKKNKNLVLFTGDIEEGAEQKISARFPKTYIIKAPHHGSKTSSSDELLNAVSPKNVVISLGKKNKFGHPHKEVIDRYKKRGINIYRTDLDGLITFDLNDFKIYTYNGKNSIMTIIIIYLQVLVSMILVLYREERWTIQYL